jgi:ATP-dependent DNA helicase RecQ
MSKIRPFPLAVLKKYWGFNDFRPLQEDIIHSVIQGNDTITLLPTGGGKSICFQVPGMVLEGLTLVISPLVALMQDQVQNLKNKGISAAYLSGHQNFHEQDVILNNCIYGKIKFLYVAPERLKHPLLLQRLEALNIGLIAVDEAHCISHWGHDFRPEYREIKEIRKYLPHVPCLALTATATQEVVDDIAIQLDMRKPQIFKQSFVRSNLSYNVRQTANKFGSLMEILNKFKGLSTIIFVSTRAHAVEVARLLADNGLPAVFYHAGLKSKERAQVQETWIADKQKIMVATNAFGMGIDKPDVRLVVHYDLPLSPESYFQEAGRAGRDGVKAYSVVIYDRLDEEVQGNRIKQNFLSAQKIEEIYQHLANHLQVPLNEQPDGSFTIKLASFCKDFQLKPVEVVAALKALHQMGYILWDSETVRPSTLMAMADQTRIYQYQLENKSLGWLAQLLVRNYGGLFHGFVRIDEEKIAIQSQRKTNEVVQGLNKLSELQLFNYQPGTDEPFIEFLAPRIKNIHPHHYLALKNREEQILKQWDAMLHFCQEEQHCRTQYLIQYFGESVGNCGHCDICRKENNDNWNQEDLNLVFQWVKSKKTFTISEINLFFNRWNNGKLVSILLHLIHSEIIIETEPGVYEKR